jgi:hypothetical protein
VWEDHNWLVPRIRAALDAKVPPSAIILRDPAHKDHTVWDLKLIAAYHIHADMMVGNIPIYWDQSDRVAFDVRTGVSKSRAAIERREEAATGKGKKVPPGTFYYAVPRTIDGDPLPTMEEWLIEKAEKEGRSRPPVD